MRGPTNAILTGLPERYPAQRRIRLSSAEALPPRGVCALLAADGVARVAIDEPVDLSDPRSLDVIRFNRDCVAVGIALDWTVGALGDVNPAVLMHLSPPAELPGHQKLLDAWTDFAFGVLYWRQGPGFITIRDIRPAFEPAWYELDAADSLELFASVAEPQPIAVCERFGAAFSDLRDAHLVLAVGDACVALPYRIHKWPVPFLSV